MVKADFCLSEKWRSRVKNKLKHEIIIEILNYTYCGRRSHFMKNNRFHIAICLLALVLFIGSVVTGVFREGDAVINIIGLAALFSVAAVAIGMNRSALIAVSSLSVILYTVYAVISINLFGSTFSFRMALWYVFIFLSIAAAIFFRSTAVRRFHFKGAEGKSCESMTGMQDSDDISGKKAPLLTVDDVTELYNTNVFYNIVEQYMSISRRHNIPMSIMLVRFLSYDNTVQALGRNKADRILYEIGQMLVRSTRTEDGVYTLEDGKTFALLLLTDEDGARVVKKRFKTAILKLNFEMLTDEPGRRLIQIRAGIAQLCADTSSVLKLRLVAENDLEHDI